MHEGLRNRYILTLHGLMHVSYIYTIAKKYLKAYNLQCSNQRDWNFYTALFVHIWDKVVDRNVIF